jgi:hypothetical protein
LRYVLVSVLPILLGVYIYIYIYIYIFIYLLLTAIGLMPGGSEYKRQGYGLDVRGWILHSVHTGSGAHSVSYPMSTGGPMGTAESIPRCVKLTTHLHLAPRLTMVELYLHSTIYLHGIILNHTTYHRDNFTLFNGYSCLTSLSLFKSLGIKNC